MLSPVLTSGGHVTGGGRCCGSVAAGFTQQVKSPKRYSVKKTKKIPATPVIFQSCRSNVDSHLLRLQVDGWDGHHQACQADWRLPLRCH